MRICSKISTVYFIGTRRGLWLRNTEVSRSLNSFLADDRQIWWERLPDWWYMGAKKWMSWVALMMRRREAFPRFSCILGANIASKIQAINNALCSLSDAWRVRPLIWLQTANSYIATRNSDWCTCPLDTRRGWQQQAKCYVENDTDSSLSGLPAGYSQQERHSPCWVNSIHDPFIDERIETVARQEESCSIFASPNDGEPKRGGLPRQFAPCRAGRGWREGLERYDFKSISIAIEQRLPHDLVL